MVESKEKPERPKTLIATLKAGFDITTRHWSILLLPILLDCVFWLGPRFRFAKIVRSELTNLVNQAPADFNGFQPEAVEQFYQLIERSNLLTALSVPLFGIPALLHGITPEKIPLKTATVEVGSFAQVAVFMLAFTVGGLLLSGIFYWQVARVVLIEQGGAFGRKPVTKMLHLLILGILVFVLLILLMFPLIFVATIAGLFSVGLAYLVLFGGSVVIMWGVILTSFSAHALMINEQSPLQAIWQSIRFVRNHLGRALPLWLIVLVIRSLLENVMLSADNGSWLTFVSIVGHAFIATALLMATFIFYNENASTPISVLNA